MKINDSFLRHDSDGESLLIPTGSAKFSGIVRGNKTLGEIVGFLMNETSRDEVVSAMLAKYGEGAPREAIERDVDRVISELRGIGALDE